jgi:hypothetical protein
MPSSLHITFPPEILEEIFLHVVSGYQRSASIPLLDISAGYSTSSYLSRSSPYSISHVSRQWRNIVLRLPHLWTHIGVVNANTNDIIQLLEEWLHRARSLPLSFSFFEDDPNCHSAAKVVLAFFLNHIHRCVSFEMILKVPLRKLLIDRRVPQTQAPVLLESVFVWLDEPDASSEVSVLSSLLLGSRTLRSALWRNQDLVIWSPIPLQKISQSWGSLRELTLYLRLPLNSLISALSFCRHLERLAICERILPSVTPQNVTLPRLTHLSASLQAMRQTLFSCITVPSLTDLEILGVEGRAWEHITGMLERSTVMLRALQVRRVEHIPEPWDFDECEFVQSLITLPFQELRVLEVENQMWLDAMKFLMHNYSKPRRERVIHTGLERCYLPRLEKLALLITNTRIIEQSPLSSEFGDFRCLQLSPRTIQRLRSLLREM